MSSIEKALEALDRMLKEKLKPRRTGPKIRRPVKTKPNAPGGSKPKRKKFLKSGPIPKS